MIKYDASTNSLRYFDKNGNEVREGNFVKFEDGRIRKVYLTDEGYLGTDATNPSWIASGKAVECEFGIYPFDEYDMATLDLVFEAVV